MLVFAVNNTYIYRERHPLYHKAAGTIVIVYSVMLRGCINLQLCNVQTLSVRQGSDSTAMRFKSTFTVAQTAVSQSQTHPYTRLLTCGRRYEATRETEWCCSNVAAGSRIADRPYIFTWTEERRGREEEVLQVVLKLCVGWLRMRVWGKTWTWYVILSENLTASSITHNGVWLLFPDHSTDTWFCRRCLGLCGW